MKILVANLGSTSFKYRLFDLPAETQGIYAVYPPGRFTQPKVRAFIDFLVHAFADKGPIDW